MRPIYLIFTCILIWGCNKQTTTESVVSPASSSDDIPYLWGSYSTPKALQISSAFTDEEVQNIKDMADAWKDSVSGEKVFFSFAARTSEISNNTELDDLMDSVLGVYKTDSWPSDLPGSALAVTQIFGLRKNAGKPNEYVDIQHADILLNEDVHDFDTEDSGPNYDLRTVILHEMGHFLGLQHKSLTSSRSSSIMYPSISSSENKREPTEIDAADIREKYGLGASSGGVQALMIRASREANDPGIPVKIRIELHSDGFCVHKINGIIAKKHRWQH